MNRTIVAAVGACLLLSACGDDGDSGPSAADLTDAQLSEDVKASLVATIGDPTYTTVTCTAPAGDASERTCAVVRPGGIRGDYTVEVQSSGCFAASAKLSSADIFPAQLVTCTGIESSSGGGDGDDLDKKKRKRK